MNASRSLVNSVWILAIALVAMPALAQENALRSALNPDLAVGTIHNGVDLWRTPADGTTFMSFADNPIPAGFFCGGSEPFSGTVHFRGVPVATVPEGAFDGADTVVQRLDDAVFNARGIAHTRLQMRALSLVGIEPIETRCGLFDVSASLHGEQPMTEMRIVRKRTTGGFFVAPLELNVRLRFSPADAAKGQTLELFDTVKFPGLAIPWTSRVHLKRGAAFVLIDTDGDALPDTFVPGKSNFDRPPRLRTKFDICQEMPQECACHAQGGEQHCVPL